MSKRKSNQATLPIKQRVIEHKIFLLRGTRVMLDRDLATLYGVETRALNQAVKRNIDRFPRDFMFQLDRQEISSLSQIVISSGLKFSPKVFAFTEQGVAMLSSVLRSKRAIRVNIEIMRTFVRFKNALAINEELASKLSRLEKKTESHDEEIQSIFEAMRQLILPPEKPKRRIGFHAKV